MKKKTDTFMKYVWVAKTVDCFRELSRWKQLMQQNYDNLLARTETLIRHCVCIMTTYLKAGTNNLYQHTDKSFWNFRTLPLYRSDSCGWDDGWEHQGYHGVMYLGCPVEQTTFPSWITHSIGLSWTSPHPKIKHSGLTADTFLPHHQIYTNTY